MGCVHRLLPSLDSGITMIHNAMLIYSMLITLYKVLSFSFSEGLSLNGYRVTSTS